MLDQRNSSFQCNEMHKSACISVHKKIHNNGVGAVKSITESTQLVRLHFTTDTIKGSTLAGLVASQRQVIANCLEASLWEAGPKIPWLYKAPGIEPWSVSQLKKYCPTVATKFRLVRSKSMATVVTSLKLNTNWSEGTFQCTPRIICPPGHRGLTLPVVDFA